MYQTLYRKYRPKKFSDIVGQDSIVKILQNSIKNNHISHAYLFIGPRGTGKTSTAKIFARAVNCTNSKDGDICGECDACKISSNSLDIIEMDAASNRKIDNIRDLIDKTTIVPSSLRYKVYIIDEVHMLTNEAFNALLKTIEEPPDYVIFILATTEPQKVPATIISRCQCFNFNRISENNIVKNLRMISDSEGIKVSDDVLNEIAVISDGGMRDSISLLDKVSSYSSSEITLDEFLSLNGLVTNDDIQKFLTSICNSKFDETLNIIESWNDRGSNIIQVMIQVLNYLKNSIVNSYISSKEFNDVYLKIANLINNNLSNARLSSNPKIFFEILFLNFMDSIDSKNDSNASVKVLNVKNDSDIKKKNLENNISQKISAPKSTKTVENDSKNISREIISDSKESFSSENNYLDSNIKDIMNVRVNNAFCEASKDIKNKYIEDFKKLYDYSTNSKIGGLCGTLSDGNIVVASPSIIVISFDYDGVVCENYQNISKMESILKDILNLDVNIAIISNSDWINYKNDFIKNYKNNVKYKIIDEPKLTFDTKKVEKKENNDGNLDGFSDILDIEN